MQSALAAGRMKLGMEIVSSLQVGWFLQNFTECSWPLLSHGFCTHGTESRGLNFLTQLLKCVSQQIFYQMEKSGGVTSIPDHFLFSNIKMCFKHAFLAGTSLMLMTFA